MSWGKPDSITSKTLSFNTGALGNCATEKKKWVEKQFHCFSWSHHERCHHCWWPFLWCQAIQKKYTVIVAQIEIDRLWISWSRTVWVNLFQSVLHLVRSCRLKRSMKTLKLDWWSSTNLLKASNCEVQRWWVLPFGGTACSLWHVLCSESKELRILRSEKEALLPSLAESNQAIPRQPKSGSSKKTSSSFWLLRTFPILLESGPIPAVLPAKMVLAILVNQRS